jgi:hypothetical protein
MNGKHDFKQSETKPNTLFKVLSSNNNNPIIKKSEANKSWPPYLFWRSKSEVIFLSQCSGSEINNFGSGSSN